MHQVEAQLLTLGMPLYIPASGMRVKVRCTIHETGDRFLGNIIESLCNSCLTMWRQFSWSDCPARAFLMFIGHLPLLCNSYIEFRLRSRILCVIFYPILLITLFYHLS